MLALANVLFLATALLYLAASVLFVGDLAGVGSGGGEGAFRRVGPLRPHARGHRRPVPRGADRRLVARAGSLPGGVISPSPSASRRCSRVQRLRARAASPCPHGRGGAFVAQQARSRFLAPSPRVRRPGGRRWSPGSGAALQRRFVVAEVQLVRHRALHARVGGGGGVPAPGAAPQTKAARGGRSPSAHRRARPRRAPVSRRRLPTAHDRHPHRDDLGTGGPGRGAADVARAVLSYAAWALIAGVLLLRAAAGWRGRRAAVGTILGFGLTMLVLVFYLVRSVIAGRHA